MKKRIIINIDGVDEEAALAKVYTVVCGGRVSGIKNDHYCWYTTFKDGTAVSVKTKYNTNTDTFDVYKTLNHPQEDE